MRCNRISVFFAAAAILVHVIGCGKDDGPKDTEKPVMTVSLPTDNQVIILSLDSLHILLNVADNDKLKSFTVELKTSGGTTLYSDSPADVMNKNYYLYHRHFNPPGVSADMDAVLSLSSADKSGNTENKTINISFAP